VSAATRTCWHYMLISCRTASLVILFFGIAPEMVLTSLFDALISALAGVIVFEEHVSQTQLCLVSQTYVSWHW
jgi:hypothetical protein